MPGFKDRLAKMNETWNINREERGGGNFNDAFEDGVHSFQLQSFRLRESNASGELMAVAEHYCLEGAAGGEVYTSFFNLEKANDEGKIWGQIFLAQLLESLGYEAPEDMGCLEEILAEIEADAPKYTARVRTNKDGYKNFGVIRVTEQKAEFEGERTEEPTAAPAPARSTNGARKAPAPPPEETPAEEAPATDPELETFCQAWDVTPADDSMESILAALREYEWKAADLTADELKLLNQHGIPVTAKAAPRPAPRPAPAVKVAPRAPAPRPGPKPGRAAAPAGRGRR